MNRSVETQETLALLIIVATVLGIMLGLSLL